MPPKTGKKKKTKEELEEERRLAEEAARLAEEERLRLEEEERQHHAELERQRQEFLTQLTATEDERLQAEHADLESFVGQLRLERTTAATHRAKNREWERFLSCTYVPHPRDRVAISDQLGLLREGSDTELSDALGTCQDCNIMIDEATYYKWVSWLAGEDGNEAQHAKDVASLHEIIGLRIDRVSAHLLQHADAYANEKGEIQIGTTQGSFQWALWVNTSKNPRLKAVEMTALHMVVEVPKQIALANIAMRVQLREKDEYFSRCTNEFMAIGGVLYADLLALPPPAKHVKLWVLRQITPLASNVLRVPYPIPPAGADPTTYRSEEEPPPLGFAHPFPRDKVLLDGEQVKVGWWDAETQSWSRQGVSDVQLDLASGSLSFRTTHLGALAVIQSRIQLLPYSFWSLRPTGGRGGKTATITLNAPGCKDPLVLEVGAGWCSLGDVPSFPCLATLCGVKMPPEQLLLKLSEQGLHLLPEDRDAQFAGVTVKDRATETAMCYDLALLSGAFLIARSKWNQGAAKTDECVCRISEVTDWEGGGRTEAKHVERVFTKEKTDGDRRVLAVIRRGPKGVAFTDALDKKATYPELPGHESVESVQACIDSVWGESHASLVSLLWANVPDPEAEVPPPPPPPPPPQNEDSMAEPSSSSLLGVEDSSAEVAAPLAPVPSNSIKKPSKPSLGPAGLDQQLIERLQATPAGLELVRRTDPVFTETVAQTLLLLRVFSFS